MARLPERLIQEPLHLFGKRQLLKPRSELFANFIAISSQEMRLKRLGEEIRKASRKINALEQVLIPGLDQEISRIEVALEEREREAIGRLKRFKASREGGSS